MNTASRVSRGIVGTIIAVVLLGMPSFAAAGSASVLTKQVLPQGANACAPLFVKSVTPYIYDGELQSFDIVLSDASYVGLLGAAGDVSIPFNYMSRRIDADGSLRLHIDTTVAVNGVLPVTVTLLSAPLNAPVCLSQVSFTTDVAGNIESSTPISVPTPTIDSGTDTGSTPTTGGGVSTGGISSGGSNAASGGKGTTPVVGSTSSTSTSVGSLVAKMCTKNGAYQLWFILLAIFFVISAFVGLSEPALAVRHGALPAVLIGIPLVLLLLFWQFAPDCRLSYFIPVILLVAAAIGLYSAYRTSPIMQPILIAPVEKKTTVTKTEETKTEIK
ncbi:MAG: hypothetical protein KBD06_01250 [Candidatus Pacebacteria bacterium]|nr:hypothetical protein [Candidatus Paceibacterota bacterium]